MEKKEINRYDAKKLYNTLMIEKEKKQKPPKDNTPVKVRGITYDKSKKCWRLRKKGCPITRFYDSKYNNDKDKSYQAIVSFFYKGV